MSLVVDIRKRLESFDLDVSFELPADHEGLALLGASGCGKSMTLKCIAGIERPDEGLIELNGRALFDSDRRVDLPPQERRVGYLFQSYALFPNMTVEQNVMAAVRLPERGRRRERAHDLLAAMRLEGLAARRPAALSGGQQQRVALARVLANEPELLLLDEPFSALDGHLRWQLEMELSRTLRSFPGGVLYVSHDRDEVYRGCDTVCVLNEGVSDPKMTMGELFSAPVTLGAALISGCKNVSRARMAAPGTLLCTDWGVTLACCGEVGEETSHAGIRAHHLMVEGERGCPSENPLACTVDQVIDSTFSTIVMLRTPGGGPLRFELEKERWRGLGVGSDVVLHVASECVMPLVERGRGGARVA